MGTVLFIIVCLIIGYFYVTWYIKKKKKGFEAFYHSQQSDQIGASNAELNKLLTIFNKAPSKELGERILSTLQTGDCCFILVYKDNSDPNDTRQLVYENSINFRKIKNGNIGVFTDFGIMKEYVGDYISTDLIPFHQFVAICKEKGLSSITLNFTVNNPYQVLLR